MAEHVWVEGWCKHCGASEGGYHQTIAAGGTSTCLERPVSPSALAREPARRTFAIEDFDVIGARVAELDKERAEAVNRTGAE